MEAEMKEQLQSLLLKQELAKTETRNIELSKQSFLAFYDNESHTLRLIVIKCFYAQFLVQNLSISI